MSRVSNWLTAQVVTDGAARTIFSSSEDARSLGGNRDRVARYFLKTTIRRYCYLSEKIWIFLCYPMMRGYGATSSTRRLICIALLKLLLGNNAEAREYVRRAEMAIHASYPEGLWPRYEAWIDQVKIGFGEAGLTSGNFLAKLPYYGLRTSMSRRRDTPND